MDYGKKILLILILLFFACEHKKFENPSDPNNIPPAPILISPVNDSLIPENPPIIIRWEVKEDSNNPLFGDPIESKLEFATNQNFSPAESIIDYFVAFDPRHIDIFFGESTYYWRVATRYVDGSWSEYSEVFSFQVKLPIVYDSSYSGRDIVAYDNYLFFSDEYNFLEIFDISNPTLPIHVKQFAPPDFSIADLFIKDHYLYAINQYNSYRLAIIDLSDPLNPELLTNLDLERDPDKFWVEGNQAYIISNYDVTVFDVTNPESVYVVDSISLPIYGIRDFAVVNNYIYLLSYSNFAVFDLSSDSVISYLDIPDGQQFCIEGNYAYIIGEELNIIDLSNPFQLTLISNSDIAGNHIYKDNNIICIINNSYTYAGLKVFDATFVGNLIKLGEIRYSFFDLVLMNDVIITTTPLRVFKVRGK